MKYFRNKVGLVLCVTNEDVIKQMEKHPEAYTPCGAPKAEKADKPGKTEVKPEEKPAEAGKAEKADKE